MPSTYFNKCAFVVLFVAGPVIFALLGPPGQPGLGGPGPYVLIFSSSSQSLSEATLNNEDLGRRRVAVSTYLGPTGRGGGRRRHGRTAVVALTSAGAGAGGRSCPGRWLGSSTPRSERGHSLGCSLR